MLVSVILEDPKFADLGRNVLHIRDTVFVFDTDEDQQTGADRTDHSVTDRHLSARYALYDSSHRSVD